MCSKDSPVGLLEYKINSFNEMQNSGAKKKSKIAVLIYRG